MVIFKKVFITFDDTQCVTEKYVLFTQKPSKKELDSLPISKVIYVLKQNREP